MLRMETPLSRRRAALNPDRPRARSSCSNEISQFPISMLLPTLPMKTATAHSRFQLGGHVLSRTRVVGRHEHKRRFATWRPRPKLPQRSTSRPGATPATIMPRGPTRITGRTGSARLVPGGEGAPRRPCRCFGLHPNHRCFTQIIDNARVAEYRCSQDVSATKVAPAEELREIDAGRITALINGAQRH